MYGNPSVIPSVQVGAGVPLQSTQASLAQGSIRPNMAPVQAGSIMQVPPGTMVPVNIGGSIVHVPTQPVATQSVMSVSMQPVQQVQEVPQYETQAFQVPVETTQEQYIQPPMEGLIPAPQYGNITTPALKTLTPKVVRNQLPPQHKQVVLPAKIVRQVLPPIGPPPTPANLDIQLPQPTLPPVQTVSSTIVPQSTIQTVQSTVLVPQQIPTIQVPVQSVMAQPMYNSSSVGQFGQVSVPNYTTTSVPQMSTPNFGTTSITQVTPQY